MDYPVLMCKRDRSFLMIRKWFLKKIGANGLVNLLAGYDNKSAYALCTLAVAKSSKDDVIVMEGKTNGRIVEPRGSFEWGWDSIFEPQGYDRTYAEMTDDEKLGLSHNSRAMEQLQNLIKQ
jgi:inosine triphosphate pyrophosphatase